MLKWLVGLMTALAFTGGQAAQVDRMSKRSAARILFRRARGVIEYGVADVAIISDYFASIAFVLAIMTTETARRS